MRIHFALRQQNIAQLEAVATAVSDPDSPQYGQYLPPAEATAIVAPSPDVRARVVAWLAEEGVPAKAVSGSLDSVRLIAPVAVIEQVFHTSIVAAEHELTGDGALVAVGEWSVPAHLANDIAMITGISDFPIRRSSAARATLLAGDAPDADGDADAGENPYSTPSTYSNSAFGNDFWPQLGRVVPQTIQRVYNISADHAQASSKVTQAAVEFQGVDCFSYTDMEQFQIHVGVKFTNVSKIIGDTTRFQPISCQGETNLDLEQMLGVASQAQTWYFSVDQWIYEFTQEYLALPAADSPMVTSLSYGWMANEQCQIGQAACSKLGVSSQGYVERCNTELAKLAAAGKSVIVCTQDEGAPSDLNTECQNSQNPVTPIYPASSPWVTSVGSTALLDKFPKPSTAAVAADAPAADAPICSKIRCSQGTKEAVAMSPNAAFTSGGGFADYAARPAWQDAAVKSFLADSSALRPDSRFFNASNRAYPDIATMGTSIFYLANWGQPGSHMHTEGGTSASTPIFSGIVSLLNSVRVESGAAPLGFVAPLLYKMADECPECFNIITSGNNTCTGWGRQMPCCDGAGYGARNGWSPTVGLGTPNVGNMIEYVKRMKR